MKIEFTSTDVNEQLNAIGISPIKTHSEAFPPRLSVGKQKLSQVTNILSHNISKKLNVSVDKVQPATSSEECKH